MIEKLKMLWKDEEGASAVEYGLMVAGIAALIVGAVFALGGSLGEFFKAVDTNLIKEATGKVTKPTTP